jgi:formylglycine-generating enzyme required for sulfatase activity
MRRHPLVLAAALASALAAPAFADDGALCPPDAVRVGPLCVDKYEASVWQIPPANTDLIQKVQAGRASAKDLTAGGATLIGCELVFDATANYPDNFPNNGQWTPVPHSDPRSPGVYAASVAGVRPTTCTSWFRAAQLCRLSGKRLLRNDEWQDAAAGTPDPGAADDGTTTCATNSADIVRTGSRRACRSNWGAFDMIGNAAEWVADWLPLAGDCQDVWPFDDFNGDRVCLAPGGDSIPAALKRGGTFLSGTTAGVFTVTGDYDPTFFDVASGFRCGR